MDGVVLVLDRSGSMGWSSKSDDREVCGNGIDDDRDGSVDESDCAETRLSFLQASARAWLQLAETAGIHAGIVTFEETADLAEDLRPLGGMATTGLTDAVDNLRLGNNTAIGEGLRRTISAFEDYEARIDTSLNKAAFLFSDGKNDRGEEPDAVIPDVRVAGIRVYTLSTGEASDPAAAPWGRVVRDPYFVLVELRHPNPGEWLLEVRAKTGAGSVQTGNMTVFTDHPKVDLFTSVDRPVVEERETRSASTSCRSLTLRCGTSPCSTRTCGGRTAAIPRSP
ncbi:MAG: vWA domain-containing protein [Planctomycetota bacterium]